MQAAVRRAARHLDGLGGLLEAFAAAGCAKSDVWRVRQRTKRYYPYSDVVLARLIRDGVLVYRKKLKRFRAACGLVKRDVRDFARALERMGV